MPFDEEDLDPHGECAAEITRLRTALSALVLKIDKIVESDAFKGVFQIAALHGCEYNGEKWGGELSNARAALEH